MSTGVLDKAPKPLLAQIQAALRKDPAANHIALVWPDPLPVPVYQGELDGHAIEMKYCVSELAMREALIEHVSDTCLVLVSKFNVLDLARDVLARLWRCEPQRISPWKTLEELTLVQSIDPRLPKKYGKWMAEALLGNYDRYARQIQFGDVLDHDSAWQALAVGYLNYNQPGTDLSGLFAWSISPGASEAGALPEDMAKQLIEWVRPSLGDIAEVVASLIVSQNAADLLPVALACAVLFSDEVAEREQVSVSSLYTARGKFSERQLGGLSVKNAVLAKLGQEAEKYVAAQFDGKGAGYSSVKGVLSKAEQFLASVDVQPIAESSTVLPAGFRLRLQRFAQALSKNMGKSNGQVVLNALEAVKSHAMSVLPAQRDQIERAQMAVRLSNWLDQSPASGTIQDLFSDYVDQGAFVDWARTKIWAGDADEVLSQAYHKLVERVSARREEENLAAAKQLDAIARGDQLEPQFMYVEHALESLLAPIAENNPILFLVMDGMSQAVFRELMDDLAHHSWVELQPEQNLRPMSLVCALPTITKVSRCSLLSGVLKEGLAADEKKAFADHAALKRIASTKFPPALFQKQDLQQSGSGALNSTVRATIASRESRILAAVINAVDDQLSSSSQVAFDWSLDALRILWQVLEAAREAGRVVIMTSDHGHVLDHDSYYLDTKSGSGERYHLDQGLVRDQEVLVSGARVVTTGNTAVLPWSERVRYSKTRSMGYHGGASLQELLIPVGVFVSAGEEDVLPGWQEVPVRKPAWWGLDANSHIIVQEQPAAGGYKAKKPAAERMDDLFVEPEPVPAESNWIDQLFEQPVYQEMRARVGRLPITEQELKTLLSLLTDNKGQVMQSVVVRTLNKPEIRMRGFLSAAQRLLNVDGYPILQVNRESQTISLDIRALKTQFEL